ncbi:MAG TPA: hypothetical protein VNJ08_04240 [Bacteriovoracaceae bacterium]|nr:hypothetical protein [Bacteriovoracaceae bacterium]
MNYIAVLFENTLDGNNVFVGPALMPRPWTKTTGNLSLAKDSRAENRKINPVSIIRNIKVVPLINSLY